MNSAHHKSDVLVIGAGLAGLTYAFRAKNQGFSVSILEASPRAGGVIRSEWRDGFLLEFGPQTVLPNQELLNLGEEAGLLGQLEWADPNAARFIQFGGKLNQLPTSPISFFKTKLLSLGGRLRLLKEPLVRVKKDPLKEESLLEFAERRLGREIAERLVAPFVSGVWAGDAAQLSARACFPKLIKMESEKGSLFKGMLSAGLAKKNSKGKFSRQGLLSFQNGLETLPKTLALHLRETIHFNTTVKPIELRDRSSSPYPWLTQTETNTYETKQIVMAAPAFEVSRLIHKFAPQGSQALDNIPYVPMIVGHLAFKKTHLSHHLNGFGYLVAPSEKKKILGCLWSSSLFPKHAPQDSVLLTIYAGGALQSNLVDLEERELKKSMIQEIQPVLGIRGDPEFVSLHRIKKAIPQYTRGHLQRLEIIKATQNKFPGLIFTGNYLSGISVGDVIKEASALIKVG